MKNSQPRQITILRSISPWAAVGDPLTTCRTADLVNEKALSAKLTFSGFAELYPQEQRTGKSSASIGTIIEQLGQLHWIIGP